MKYECNRCCLVSNPGLAVADCRSLGDAQGSRQTPPRAEDTAMGGQKQHISTSAYFGCVVLGAVVKTSTTLLNRMCRLRAQPSDVLIASDSLWFVSYLILLCSELAACTYERKSSREDRRQRLTPAEVCQCLLIALVYTLMCAPVELQACLRQACPHRAYRSRW